MLLSLAGSGFTVLSSCGATVGCPLSASADPGALPVAPSVCVSAAPAALSASELSVAGVVEPVSASPDAGRLAGVVPSPTEPAPAAASNSLTGFQRFDLSA
jgi:hypothetical protein